MKLYNTLSGKKEPFSVADSKVKMYVCGVTPYAASHIGHAMFSVVFDVVRRYLEFRGYEVDHVQNFTDIDDKMIRSASELGISTEELAESNIEDEAREERSAMNCERFRSLQESLARNNQPSSIMSSRSVRAISTSVRKSERRR